MAKTTITQITDDIDGSKGAAPYRFAWQGDEYEIDLSNANFKRFHKAIEPYLEVATKVSKRSLSSRRSSSSSSKRDFSKIRTWAKGQGLEVSERGRIPKAIVEQYDAAH
jgi:hypothetical protein